MALGPSALESSGNFVRSEHCLADPRLTGPQPELQQDPGWFRWHAAFWQHLLCCNTGPAWFARGWGTWSKQLNALFLADIQNHHRMQQLTIRQSSWTRHTESMICDDKLVNWISSGFKTFAPRKVLLREWENEIQIKQNKTFSNCFSTKDTYLKYIKNPQKST